MRTKKRSLIFIMLAVLIIQSILIIGVANFTANAKAVSGQDYHHIDENSMWGVYSNAGGSIYASYDAVSVTPMTSNVTDLGVTLIDENDGVLYENASEDSYIILKFQHAIARTNNMYVSIVDGDGYTYSLLESSPYYIYDDSEATTTALATASNAMSITSSATECAGGYMAIPFSTLGISSTIDIGSVNFYANYWIRFNVYEIFISDNFDATDLKSTELTSIWKPSATSFTTYNNANVVANYLRAGEAYFDNLQAGTNYADAFYIKFPDSMIGDDNLVDFSSVKGFFVELQVQNYLSMTWTFTSESGITYNTYSANKKTRLYKDGTVDEGSDAKYFNSGADDIAYFPFTANTSDNVVAETFTSSSTPDFTTEKFSPIFKLQLDRGSSATEAQSNAQQIIKMANTTFITDDTLYEQSVGDTNNVTVTSEYQKSYIGAVNSYSFKFDSGYEVISGDIGGVSLSQEDIATINSDNQLDYVVDGETEINLVCDIKEYSITYDLGNGQLGSLEENPTTYTINDEIVLYSPTLSGEIFVGWYDQDGNKVVTVGSNTAKDLSLTARYESGDAIFVNVEVADNFGGSAYVKDTQVASGESTILYLQNNYGKILSSVLVNGSEMIESVQDNILAIENITELTTIVVSFSYQDEYTLCSGSIFSLNSGYYGTVFSDKNAIALSTTVSLNSSLVGGDATLWETIRQYQVGISAEVNSVAVSSDKYLAIELSNITNSSKDFYVSVTSGGTEYNLLDNSQYYLVDSDGTVSSYTGSKIATTSGSINDTVSVTTYGFSGTVVIPMTGFDNVTTIDSINVYATINPARYTVANMYLLDSFDTSDASMSADDIIFAPSETNYSLYGQDVASYVTLEYLNANDYVFKNIANLNDNNTVLYDSLYITLPEEMINEDGLVNLSDTGIVGIAMEVENVNLESFSLALRIAGADNPSLTDTTATMWQTSNSLASSRLITDSGLVKIGNTSYLPKEFSGTVYIPMNIDGFTNIGLSGSFPEEILPIIRVLPAALNSTAEDYRVNISNIRFVTNELDYQYYSITSTSANGILSGTIGNNAVGQTENNKAVYGTTINYKVTPNAGYEISRIAYTYLSSDEIYLLDTDSNEFSVIVKDDLLVSVEYTLITYNVTYELDGGVNNSDNATTFTYVRGFDLSDPTKDGYVFDGWYLDSDFTTEVTEIESGQDSDITLYAKWISEADAKSGCGSSVNNIGTIAGAMLLLMALMIICRKKGKKNA